MESLFKKKKKKKHTSADGSKGRRKLTHPVKRRAKKSKTNRQGRELLPDLRLCTEEEEEATKKTERIKVKEMD